MTRRSWTHSVPLPPSLWEQRVISSSGTEMLVENRTADRLNLWSWSSLMEACSWWTNQPTPSGTTAFLSARRSSFLELTSLSDASYYNRSWQASADCGMVTKDLTTWDTWFIQVKTISCWEYDAVIHCLCADCTGYILIALHRLYILTEQRVSLFLVSGKSRCLWLI